MTLRAALLVLATLAAALPASAASTWMMAQAQVPPPAASPRARPSAPAKTTMAPAPKEESKPTWAELSAQQQLALRPLGASWKTLSEQHKRKWIALSGNYQRMPPNEQQLLHSRMSEWAALSPQQRTQARLNFADTKKVPPQDKKAMWEAYQALPAEEKRKLAAGAQAVKPSPPPTAAAVKPVPPQKLTKVPAPKNNRTPGIAVAPNQVDHNTLLPQPGAVPPRQN